MFLGKALKRYPRDSFYVADKFNVQAEPDYKNSLPSSWNGSGWTASTSICSMG